MCKAISGLDNDIDNDCDFKTDCEDEDCSAFVEEPISIMGTCPICCDGKLRIVAYNLNGHPLRVYTLDANGNEIDFMPTNNSTFESPELPDGTYIIYIVNLETGCEITKTAIINSLPEVPEPEACCPNGNFENGNFDGWTGNGINYPPYYPPGGQYSGLELDENGCIIDMGHSNHVILPSGSTDPLVPELDLTTNENFIVRLGSPIANSTYGVFKKAELNYCFTVKECNAMFRFNYAMVLQDPLDANHGGNHFAPWFRYGISTSGGTEIVSSNSTRVIGDIHDTDNFEAVANGDVAWKGWTCEAIDLSGFLGQEVCIKFESSHCGFKGHAGYVYINGLCQSEEEVLPIAKINANGAYCSNQTVSINANGSRNFNEHRWTICRNVQGGNQCFSTPFERGSTIPEFEDALDFFFSNNVAPLECEDVFNVTLELKNDCGDASDSKNFTYRCDDFSVHYPDMVMCTNNPDVQIQGDVSNCPGCTYQWSPAQYLDDPTIPFPTILGSTNANALFETYTVIATTPEGCKYKDDLTINHTIMLFGEINVYIEFINQCEFEVYALVNFGSPVNLADVNLYFTEQISGGVKSHYQGVLMSPGATSSIGIYKLPNRVYSRLKDHAFSAVASLGLLNLDDGFTTLGNCVIKSDEFTRGFDHYSVYLQSGFSPRDQDGNNDFFGHDFSHWRSSVYYSKLTVWDRAGGLMFLGELPKTAPYHETGLRGDEPELLWDGRFDGQMMNSGVYTWVLEYSGCTGEIILEEGDVTIK